MPRSRVAALDKGSDTIACDPRFAVNYLWGSDLYI